MIPSAEAAGAPGEVLRPVRSSGGLQAHRLDLQPADGVGGRHSTRRQWQHLNLWSAAGPVWTLVPFLEPANFLLLSATSPCFVSMVSSHFKGLSFIFVSSPGIPYSEHSSFAELKRFVQWLRPHQIVPTVNNGSWAARKAMEKHFREWLGGNTST